MPELPEVEIAARQLRRWCAGKAIVRVRVHDKRIVRGGSVASFRRALTKHEVVRVDRRGKHVLAELSGGALWWLHLGMSGKFAWRAPKTKAPRHTRVEVTFDDGRFCFADMRLFGGTAAGDPAFVREVSHVDSLGPDAWIDVRTTDQLMAAIRETRGPIKVVLMDQKRLAGLGNIHAAEALFRARIHPEATADSLPRPAFVRLLRGIRAGIKYALAATEAEEVSYMSEGGGNPFRVYGRAGEPCPRCRQPIASRRLGGRNTFFCPKCQRKDGR
ncbi:MAG: bifunctional DNA-formamidopyrimidine glycosylase/DNA-(apurinic or apyrimidinic site) lyase [Myxococcota bacterium]